MYIYISILYTDHFKHIYIYKLWFFNVFHLVLRIWSGSSIARHPIAVAKSALRIPLPGTFLAASGSHGRSPIHFSVDDLGVPPF